MPTRTSTVKITQTNDQADQIGCFDLTVGIVTVSACKVIGADDLAQDTSSGSPETDVWSGNNIDSMPLEVNGMKRAVKAKQAGKNLLCGRSQANRATACDCRIRSCLSSEWLHAVAVWNSAISVRIQAI